MLGISQGNILNSGISGNLNVTYSKTAIPSSTFSKGYNSSYTVFDFRFSKELMDKVNLAVNGSVMKNEYGLTDEDDTTLRYGASLNLRPSRAWNLSLSYDGTKRDEYTTTNINTRASYRF
ncbi:MAG: hypothetical protein GY771_16075 [bacterium]|nr:hypothetical protein [bacterium]